MQAPDGGLLRTYYRDVTASSWVDKLPGKSLRFIFFTGAGILLDVAGTGGVGTAIGVAASAADTFLLDRMIQGWKPNQFVEVR